MSWFLSECDIFCVLQYHSEIRELCRRLKQQQHDFAEQEKILQQTAEQAICHNQNVQRQKIRDLKAVRLGPAHKLLVNVYIRSRWIYKTRLVPSAYKPIGVVAILKSATQELTILRLQ